MEKLIRILKQFPIIRLFFRLPGISRAYHFALAWFAAVRYGFPGRSIVVIGVTGTKGKTTTVELISSILEAAGQKVALISSLRVKVGEQSAKNMSGNSMPGRGYLQRFLRTAVDAGCRYAVVEVTSEGVRSFRHLGIRWRVAELTNLSPEHIESHGSFENYRDAKLSFLKYAANQGAFVFVNSGNEHAQYFTARLPEEQVKAYSVKDAPQIETKDRLQSLVQEFNRENEASAAAIGRLLGIEEKVIAQALAKFEGVPGRMDFVQTSPFSVVVDYAHTPDSLEKVYTSLRGYIGPEKKLICVLGACGGGRDKWKRPKMGQIAAAHCDEIILTNEDPYNEEPRTVLEQVAQGFTRDESLKHFDREPEYILDRKEAIEKAVSLAQEGDAVVMTGKGSESWIHMENDKKIPWNEKEIAQEALKKRENVPAAAAKRTQKQVTEPIIETQPKAELEAKPQSAESVAL